MKMFINGERRDASDGKTIDVLNSATLEFIDTVPAATADDVAEAIAAAKEGCRVWGSLPVYERSAILNRAADMIDARREELARSLSTEMGKIITEATPEIRVAAQIIRGFAEKANHLYGQTMTDYQVGTENDIIFTRHEPLGVVACISPFNYPVELCSQKYAAALAAGNAVIIKPSTDNPLTVMKVAEILWEAGVPGNVLQLVTGAGSDIGDLLSESPDINAITFTGSTAVGKHIAEKAAGTLKRVFLELGGNDPYIVFDDADFELAVTGAVRGRVQNAGQTCCSPKRFLVQNSIKEDFIKRAVEQIDALVMGSPLDEATELGSLISAKAANTVDEQVKLSISQGAKLICGGKLLSETYYAPTILEVTPEMDISRDMECFGPVIPVIGFDTEEEAIAIANQTMYGLQAGVLTKDINKAIRVASRLECGGVVINQSGNYRHLDQPFGGWKMSGIGREGVSVTLDEMTQVKSYILRN
ncbi:MAG: aldehyde dehydrogenase, partial [Lachnospiraceae bacterium]|nr:aldehyde dehydrogenase [Lachnospiraceae bacterium]